ncbi:MAG: hypothetical protein WB676_11560 [Bryobacteraceae bacterium]
MDSSEAMSNELRPPALVFSPNPDDESLAAGMKIRTAKDSRRRRRMALSILMFSALLAGFSIIADAFAPGGRPIIKLDGVDPAAYYLTTHSLLFDGDVDLKNQFANHPSLGGDHCFAIRPESGLPGNCWPIGFSLLQVPFLFVGNQIDLALGGVGDGYSKSCTRSYFLGIVFWLCLGMILLFHLIGEIGRSLGISQKRSDWGAFTIVLGLWPSTTLCYYTFSGMAHVADFMACSLFLLMWWHAKDTNSNLRWILCGVAAGLLALVRWQSVLFVSVPIVYEIVSVLNARPSYKLESVRSWLRPRVLACSSIPIMLIPQFLEWKRIYGSYLVVPQGRDFLVFPPSFVLHVLFSSQHGWFIWTPVVAIGTAGLLYYWRRFSALCSALLAGVVLQILMCGSLPTSWDGGASFGIRMLTNCIPAIGIGIALFVFFGSLRCIGIITAAGFLFSAYTFLFAIQYRLDLIPKGDRLTFQELLLDKLNLRSALQRKRAYITANMMLKTGETNAAIEIARAALGSNPTDRNLLSLLNEAYTRNGDSAGRDMVRAKLQSLADSRLW